MFIYKVKNSKEMKELEAAGALLIDALQITAESSSKLELKKGIPLNSNGIQVKLLSTGYPEDSIVGIKHILVCREAINSDETKPYVSLLSLSHYDITLRIKETEYKIVLKS